MIYIGRMFFDTGKRLRVHFGQPLRLASHTLKKKKIKIHQSLFDNSGENEISKLPENKIRNWNPIPGIKNFRDMDDIESYCDSLTKPDQMIEVIDYLRKNNSRHKYALRSLCEKLSVHCDSFKVLDCSKLLFCLCSLSYAHEALIHKIANDIQNQRNILKHGQLPVSLLRSFSVLKYKNTQLYDFLIGIICHDKNLVNVKDFLGILLAVTIVNHKTKLVDKVFEEMNALECKDFPNIKFYIEYVWTSVIMNNYSEKHVATVLSENFLSMVNSISYSHNDRQSVYLKLMNIHASNLEWMNIPNISKTISFIPPTATKSKCPKEFIYSITEVLYYVFPKMKKCVQNFNTDAGFTIDLEVTLDEKSKKHAIFPLTYHDYCLGERNALTGMTIWKKKILEAKNYSVIEIPYQEFDSNMKMHEKIKYFRNKLEGAGVKQVMSN